MTALDHIIENDLVASVIHDALTARERKNARTGFINICCVMCRSRGQTQDKKFRCGIIFNDGIVVTCFNCGFVSKFRVGELLSNNMRAFLNGLGVPPREVQKLVYWAGTVKDMVVQRPDVQEKLKVTVPQDFDVCDLPTGARPLEEWVNCNDPDYLDTVAYLLSRGDVAATATTYYWTPKLSRLLIIPCYHRDKIVGWMGRAIDAMAPERYFKDVPKNFLFNSRCLSIPHREYVFVLEGTFDALVIEGVAIMGAKLNEVQIATIMQSGKQPVVVADRDERGKDLIEIALAHQWLVATPHFGGTQWWDGDIKDCDDAVKRYGKLYTVQSILASMTRSKFQIRQRIRYGIAH